MSYELISYELKGKTAVIAFNDPKTMNACGVDTAQEMLPAKPAAPSSPAMAAASARAPISARSRAPRSAIRAPSPMPAGRWIPITTR